MMAELVEVRIEKLVHGGQGLGVLADGRKVFVWNALPGEVVRARLLRKKRSYADAIAEEILEASADRLPPREANYLATSPWQMMSFEAENRYKLDIVREIFSQQGVRLRTIIGTTHDDRVWQYRNKMEYSFWGDDDGMHLALHQRGSHVKQIVAGSELAAPVVDAAANSVCVLVGKADIRAGELKTIIVRSSQNGDTVGALFVKPTEFPGLVLPESLKGLRVYHSSPMSPASVPTQLLYELGDCTLEDDLLGKSFSYDVDSFFQVNIPVFEMALGHIKGHVSAGEIVDMYAGVGSIGLSVARGGVELVELDSATAKMARVNAERCALRSQVIEVSTERALERIAVNKPVIFDPPRAGLHDKVVDRVLEVQPPKVIYLSCNPATQARDLAKLQAAYRIEYFEVFNFFPRTPHIETLAVLAEKSSL